MRNASLRRATVILGIVLIVLGVLQLVWPQLVLNILVRWWPTLVTAAGVFLLYKFFVKKVRPPALFSGLLLLLSGLFILILNTGILPDGLTLKETWPVFMGIVGISLIPYGSRYGRTIRVSLMVPGIILIVLMALFLLFSLQIVKESFVDFFIRWWPLILVGMGITLIGTARLGKKDAE
jgi:uncharacterized membrane protein HdeD (DUF308 family)